MMDNRDDRLIIADRAFVSRLLVGTGKFSSNAAMVSAMENSGCEIVTVALRRVDINNPDDNILSHIDRTRYLLLPNTSGARDAEEAVRLARLARAAGCDPWVKLEVTPDPYHLMPDPIETLKATRILVKEGFTVLPYINADPILAKRLQEAGAATVMPLGAPIGTNRGVRTRDQIAIIIEQASVPVIVDAGLGAPSHAAEAMEMGADAVLVNTALAVTPNPGLMAAAFRKGVEAGREAYLAGLGRQSDRAEASSPLTGFLRG
jgi:thiazole synthase